MEPGVKRRPYSSPVREERAAATRRSVLLAARRLFVEPGYQETKVSEIAEAAGVSIDTLYTSVGRKPEILLAVIDMTLGASEDPILAEDRTYVQAIHHAATAEEKIEVYAHALGELMPKAGPLLDALRRASLTDAECAGVWERLNGRRRENMARFTAELRATGRLRQDLSDDEVGDIVWSTNAIEYYSLLAGRGWTGERYGRLLAEMWVRLLLS